MPTSDIRARFGIGESTLYRIIQRQGISLRGHSSAATAPATQTMPSVNTGRNRASSSDEHRDAAPMAAPVSTSAVIEDASTIDPAPRGRPSGRTLLPVAVVQASSSGTRFCIRYLGERVFEARSIHEALRQAESLGATDIMAVARED